ncbi:MAG TPA: TlpA disulfide reductase family protein [Pseudomonadales bacterium]|nr:TlpA disulfide reductase family protein [Pseudomonadales bacterium]
MLIVKSTMRLILIGMFALLLVSCEKAPPPVVLETLNGNPIHEQDWKGKWVYINYWADWCKPCAEEIPELNRFAAANPDVLVIGIHFDKPSTTDQLRQVNAFRIEFPVVISDTQIAFPHSIPTGLPMTFVFSPEGKLVNSLQGPQTQDSLLKAKKS